MNERHRIIGLLVDAKHLVKELRHDTSNLLGLIRCDAEPSVNSLNTFRDMARDLVDDLSDVRELVREVEDLLGGRKHEEP